MSPSAAFRWILAVTFRPGARLGPQAVRAASVQLAELKPFPWGFDPFEDLAVVDYGDCWFDAHNPLTIKDSIVNHAPAPSSMPVPAC